MKISIITVTFNAAGTIADTLASVACQTHPDIEHIVVDGASTDDTLEIIRQRGQHVSQTISEPDRGIYDAMNKGLGMATGSVIGFLNADDVYAGPTVLERVSAIIEKDKLDAIFGDAEFFSPDRPNRPLRLYRSARFRPELIAWGWMPAHPSLFLGRHVYERFGAFKTDYRIAGDFELIARVFHSGTLEYRYLPDVLVRMRTGGVSTGGWRNSLLLNREVLQACRENDIPTNLWKILSKYPAKVLEFLHK
ncbi:glycosyltransferase family 2 protein [Rhodoferax fermentans]|uniref:Glycosyl transferase n=1 Tax=Rhodoferax fermentans TaxID=28066 RepID=A0A1T1ARN5_RHOFE|nr:glycosyltransferase family 2 protein [Rhodoferax fermentans]MBK1683308.1 glycosyltransferase [Rhodoferax fermentans]OOV06635.1 glycosyl transferase [Rhodoferax fermentans]